MNNNKFTIKKANKNDIPAIYNFIKQLAIFEELEDECIAKYGDLEKYIFSENKVAHVIIGSLGKKQISMALYFYNFSTFLAKPGLYLEDLIVLQDYRGNGYGTLMLKELAKIARENDCGRLEWAVLNWNKKAINIYDSIGGIPMKEWTTYRLTGDALLNFK